MAFNLEESALEAYKKNQVTGPQEARWRNDCGQLNKCELGQVSFKRKLSVQLI